MALLDFSGDFWKRYRKNRGAVFGLGVVLILVLISVLAPILAPYGPFRMVGRPFIPPGDARHFMGTDDLGRDVYSRILIGARASLCVGFLAALISTLFGIFIGSISGYVGGRIDDILMRLTEMFQVIPQFFLGLVMVALFGNTIQNIIFVIGILSWPTTARLARGMVLFLKERQFVEAMRALGAGNLRILFSEILPNALSPIIVNGSLQIAQAILTEAGLSFLGLGDPNILSWGTMLRSAQPFIRRAWWLVISPGVAIFLAILGFNMIGDGLTDALNPRLREG